MRATSLAVVAALMVGTAGLPAPAGATSPWCSSARRQVVQWSLQQEGRGRPYVTGIRRVRMITDRVIEAPADGVILRCTGRAKLSNGLRSRVSFGFRSIDGTWYLFLHRGH